MISLVLLRHSENRVAYLSNCEADKLPSCPQVVIIASNDGKHERANKEALNLDPAATKDLDKEDCKEVAGYVARRSDDQISISILEERVILGFAFGETNRSQEHGLIEIETVKGNIDEEPARCRTDQLLQMFPLAKVDHESLQLRVFSRRRNVCFDE